MMSSVTICPNCQTQFVVTAKQLGQYNGKVRCGHCLHVFDATQHLADSPNLNQPPAGQVTDRTNSSTPSENAWPAITVDTEEAEKPDVLIKSVEETLEKTKGTEFEADEDEDFAITEEIDYSKIGQHYESEAEEAGSTPSPAMSQPSYETLTNIAHTVPKKKKVKKSSTGWLLLIILLFLAAIAQTLYFMRNTIAMYYPATKPYLQQICQSMGCSIELASNINLIDIYDSEILEDIDHEGVILLSSILINQAHYPQVYPNLELTLMDEEKKPKLRRTFKPSEYLAKGTNLEAGMPARTEVKVKLSIAAEVDTVTDYQLFLTY